MANRNLNTTSQNAQRGAGPLHDAGDAAEVLAAYPRQAGFFAWYQGYQRERLAWYVELGMLPAEVLGE
jgi:hypothetical protein